MKRIVNYSLSIFNEYQFLRFLIVGGINTLFGYAVFAFFIFIGLHYALASLFSMVLGVLFNFKTTGIIVFKNTDNSLIFRYFAVYGVSYLFNIFGLKCFNTVGINNYIAGALLILPSAILTYYLNKKIVFSKNQSLTGIV